LYCKTNCIDSFQTPKTFNAGFTSDLRLAIKVIKKRYPEVPLYAIGINNLRENWLDIAGFSLGSNVLVKYLGEEGSATPLSAAAVLSNPWDLNLADKSMMGTFVNRQIYARGLVQGLKKLVRR
jgi:predicted alpha/beta-fold hydrolase